ncbi:Surface antigen [Sphingobacterium lactis]|uniref:Surface antigen n=2 Tax=Sphingobacterium lactis TaxID=797291 RepID=A0A1H6BJE8_9SPHI|nr:Surface antigen [Sphingobacterium lactis]
MHIRLIFFLIGFLTVMSGFAQIQIQDTVSTKEQRDSILPTAHLYDIVDAFQDINPFKKKDSVKTERKRSAISYLPNLNYNPSIGAQIGIKAVGGKVLGNEPNTTMSIAATALSATTRGIIVGYLLHDIYTPGNRWNIKGGFMVAKAVGLDYGMGIGGALDNPTSEELIMNNPDRQRFVNRFMTYTFNERVYKQLFPGAFVGAGFYFELKRKFSTVGSEENMAPIEIYSRWNDFDPTRVNNNGLMLNMQYLTRDNPNSAYKGYYFDMVLRMNQTWMGSSHNAYQLQTDFRKYWQLSTDRPNHVLAFWNFGSYNLGGHLPYTDLPGTAKDTYARSGRGYTMGYFKGKSFFYSEVEYRYPILRNQFLSGVVFANVQTANDQMGTKLFQIWQPAAGAGLRLLFNKATRTNLCIDYAFGRFGQRGLFLGLNEAF